MQSFQDTCETRKRSFISAFFNLDDCRRNSTSFLYYFNFPYYESCYKLFDDSNNININLYTSKCVGV